MSWNGWIQLTNYDKSTLSSFLFSQVSNIFSANNGKSLKPNHNRSLLLPGSVGVNTNSQPCLSLEQEKGALVVVFFVMLLN